MFTFILPLLTSIPVPISVIPFVRSPDEDKLKVVNINIHRLCADLNKIPYGSDNFSKEEWEKFKECLDFMRLYKDETK